MSADPNHPLVDLTGQVALVTGGGKGLGRAFAIALARAGAHGAVTARTTAPLAETVEMVERAGGRALALPGDVSAPEAVAHVVKTAESQLGPVDILVNNAGAVGPLGCSWEADPEDWWRTFEINMRGPFLYARAVLPGMVGRQRGRIVNVSSGAGFNRLPQSEAIRASSRRRSYVDGGPDHLSRGAECGPGSVPFVVEPGTRHADRTQRTDAAISGLGTS